MAHIMWMKHKIGVLLFLCTTCSTSYAISSHDLFVTTLSILGYVQWDIPTPLLCVVNNPEVSQTFFHVIHQQKYSYQVKSVSMNNLTESSCHILLFSNLQSQQEQNILNDLHHPVLSISFNNVACELGSAFCLYKRNQRTSFKINMNSLTHSKIHIDPRVLLLSKSMELR